MRFLYKIYSNYDGFIPRRIPARLVQKGTLLLGWERYLDMVTLGDECWVYFHGTHAFEDGVYIKGFIVAIDSVHHTATLRVRDYSTEHPVTDDTTGGRIAQAIATRYRQVFLWPTEWDTVPACGTTSCSQRLCDACHDWQGLPVIDPRELTVSEIADCIAPAYWIVPTRCYVPREGKRLAAWTAKTTHMFVEFKLGERNYAYPLALGMYQALRRRDALEFDAIVPIPLSPDKATAGELHRTLALARELGRLLGVPVRQYLQLANPISKRRMIADGASRVQFERAYHHALEVSDAARLLPNILLVDDVITHGSTMRCAVRKIQETAPQSRISLASAGQMIVKAAVADDASFVESHTTRTAFIPDMQ